ncbi:hypothetical protein IMZ48_05145 [Candidatus Bathyarchaeota archaeon]|nr:hypothetical protein [Candidatus Bathyarchaeota archaeon]
MRGVIVAGVGEAIFEAGGGWRAAFGRVVGDGAYGRFCFPGGALMLCAWNWKDVMVRVVYGRVKTGPGGTMTEVGMRDAGGGGGWWGDMVGHIDKTSASSIARR